MSLVKAANVAELQLQYTLEASFLFFKKMVFIYFKYVLLFRFLMLTYLPLSHLGSFGSLQPDSDHKTA